MPPRKEEDEYFALAMELLQAEPIPTPTDDMCGCQARGTIVTRQAAWNYQLNA